MKIAIDSSNLSSLNKTRGIGIYAKRLASTLSQIDKTNTYLLATHANQLKNADLIHYPNFDLFFHTLPLIKRTKIIVTVHDVIPLVFPNKFKPGLKGKVRFRLQLKALKQANAIITDSQNSKRDIIKYLDIPSSKIKVIYLGVSPEFRPIQSSKSLTTTQNKFNLHQPFILYVGDVNYNKNIPTLIRAFSKLKNSPLDLILVSQAWSNDHIIQVKAVNGLINKLDLQTRVKKISSLFSSSIKDLVNIYNLAQAYIQPSLYEGFGLPVLEAMACGTLVVSSSASSLPEVYGKAAIKVEPTIIGLAEGITKSLNLELKRRKQLINLGKIQAAKFTWEKTASETIKIYKSVLADE